eukprot:Seg18599.2 transcript_id=Seg18599.2/GoldUCD/mRNA.D3Y31 product="D-3-phosphoglycerate dehydrogenase" protein_id=Seg18599.2/GoldUCD/D3Y31
MVVELNKDGQRFRLAGTIIGKSPRIVEIDRLFVDTNIKGHFLIVRNDDSPGVVGHVGSVLGEKGINIANLSLARNKSEGNALTVIELDSELCDDALGSLSSAKGIISVTSVSI